MKNRNGTFKSLVAAMLIIVMLAPSCKKYLSPQPISTFDPSFLFSNVPNARAALMGAYFSLAGDFGYGIRVSYYYAHDDDIIMGGGSALDQLRHQEAHYTLVAGNTDIVSTFNQFYAGIERANTCIYYIPKMTQYSESGNSADEIELRRMLGEAYTVRAQYYFELTRLWGDVPEPRVPSAFATDLFPSRTSRDTIYAHILADLALAKTLMPWRTQITAQDERFTKGSAMALRAKVALFAGGYSLKTNGQMTRPANYLDFYNIARTECAELMANPSQHSLAATFKGLFKDVIDAHKAMDPAGELIMQVAMANGTNSDSKIGLQNGTKINGVGGSLGNMLPSYFYQFDSTDVRRDVTVVPFEVVRDVFARGHASNSIYDGKFRRDWVSSPSFYFSNGPAAGISTTPSSNASLQNMQLNWPLIRFADVLLMFAEAENEINGPTTAAYDAFKLVSLRGHNGVLAQVPTNPGNKTAFFKLLVKERMLEFGGEGIRKWDLVRWNLLGTALAEAKANLARMAAGTAMVPYTYQADPPVYSLNANLPRFMYYYQNGLAEGGPIWANSFYFPTPAVAPNDPTNGNVALTNSNRVAWYANANITTTYVNFLGYGYTVGKSELYPIPQTAIDANPKLKPQNNGY